MKLLKRFVLGVILNILALYSCQRIFDFLNLYFYLNPDFKRVLFFAIILTFLNLLGKPILKIIFLPLIWITLGLFSLLINIFILRFANFIYPTIVITSFSHWLLASLIISFFNLLIYL